MKKKVGFIGLGQMGRWMALNLVKAGYHLTVYDINEAAVPPLADKGAHRALSPGDAARGARWTFLCLPHIEAVENAVFETNGVAAGAEPGQIVVDCGTSDYQRTVELAAMLKSTGFSALLPKGGMIFWRASFDALDSFGTSNPSCRHLSTAPTAGPPGPVATATRLPSG